MVKRILSYILLGTGLLIFLFFRQYHGTLIPYPFLFWLSGIAVILIAGALFISSAKDNAKRRNNHFRKLIEDLKTKGEKILIVFSQCEILENSYMEERERYSSGNIQTWNILLDPEKNIETVGINQSVLVYNHEHQGRKEKFISSTLPYDRASLLFYLDNQKTTTLYVNKENRGYYYFDLDFLNTDFQGR